MTLAKFEGLFKNTINHLAISLGMCPITSYLFVKLLGWNETSFSQSFSQPVRCPTAQSVSQLLNQSFCQSVRNPRSILSKFLKKSVDQSVSLWNLKPNSSVYLVYLRAGLKHKTYSTYITEDNRGSWLMKVLVQSFCGIWSGTKVENIQWSSPVIFRTDIIE